MTGSRRTKATVNGQGGPPHILLSFFEGTTISTIAEEKQKARRGAKVVRAEAAFAAGPGAADKAARHFLTHVGDVKDRVLAGYSPIKDEIGTSGLMTRAHAQGAICVMPVVQGKGMPLVFRRWTPETKLVEGNYGAKTPPPEAEEHIPEIIALPLLAFDAKGYRLGYGGGFYDRTLAGIRQNRIVLAIGLAFEGQLAMDLPIEPTDEPLDGIATEVEARWFRAHMKG